MKTLIFSLCLAAAALRADQEFPKPAWTDAPDPIASPDAVYGGEMTTFAGDYPQSFNYYLDVNTFSQGLFSSLYEALLDIEPVSAEYTPLLARKWTISDDKTTFTFWIDETARWSDGRPITAEDVAWTFEAVRKPENLTGPHKVGLEKFEPPTIMATNIIRFTSREVHWRNLGSLGSLLILPKHVYEKKDFNKIAFEFPVVSGPYRLGEVREGIYAKLERRPDWWRLHQKRVQHTCNFQTLTYRFYAEQENAFEGLRKGQIDLYPVYMARLWVNETKGDRFEKNWIVKQKVYNHEPVGFQGFAMNMRRPPFDDVRVREAMAYLIDRERMNTTLMYSQYFMQRSYFEDLYSAATPCKNPLFEFDKDKARELLKAAGWAADAQTGLLEKDGRPFRFTFLNRDESSNKFLAIYREALKDLGIDMKIEMKDAAAWSKDMDTFNFDMTWAAWSGSLFKDPEDMWASKEADRHSGSNITGFKDPRVDALIDKQRTLFDITARNAVDREIDALVAAQCPYALLWNINYVRLLYWNRFGTPPTVLSKFGDERSAYVYWWVDEDSAADLKNAAEKGLLLPARKSTVVFDDAFKPAAAKPPPPQ